MHLSVKGKTFPVEFAEDIQKGMMGRDSLEGCMGFNMNRGYHSFWMKDCLIPLDIVFVLKGKISKVFQHCQPCHEDDCQHYTAAGDQIFEFPAGTCDGWVPGDFVNLYLGTKNNPV